MSSSNRYTIPPAGVAFITGGARGLGLAIAQSFAREGCSGIAILDVLADETLEGAKAAIERDSPDTKCISLRCDVTDEAQVQKAIQDTVAAFGRIDYAVNAAGIAGSVKITAETDVADFEKVLRVNTVGVFICTKHQIRQMELQEPFQYNDRHTTQRGAIVNISSVNSIVAGPATGPYTTSKHGVVGLTKAAALESRRKGIRINTLAPGFIPSFLSEQGGTDPGSRLANTWAGFEARQGRAAYAEEIGDAVVLLCSPKMSIVNAHNLICDNGFTVNEFND